MNENSMNEKLLDLLNLLNLLNPWMEWMESHWWDLYNCIPCAI